MEPGGRGGGGNEVGGVGGCGGRSTLRRGKSEGKATWLEYLQLFLE